MAGGTWSTTEMPVLPGLYMNFKAAALAAVKPGARGVVAIPVKANWGPVCEFVEITSESMIDGVFTRDISGGATAYTSLYLAILGGASKVMAYRLASTDAALATLTLLDNATTGANVLTLSAKYTGTRGNSFNATVQVNPVDSSKTDIKLFEGSTLLKTFTFVTGTVQAAVNAINNDPANVWITAAKVADGSGTLKSVANQSFAGGNSGNNVTSADYSAWLNVLETQTFNLLVMDGISDAAIQTLASSWVSRVRDAGKGVIAVMGGSAADDIASDAVVKATSRSAGFNHEGIVNVGTGIKMDGVTYSSAMTACYVAGLIGGQALSESTTYAPAPFDDVTRRWTKSEQEQAVSGGVFVFFHDGRIVKPLKGINSLITLRQGQNNSWKKIRAIRVMDAINADLQATAEANYIGKVNNTSEGRISLIGAFKQYMQLLAMGGVIETEAWDVYLDPDWYGPTKKADPEPDQVFVKWDARLTDVMEQIFGTFMVH